VRTAPRRIWAGPDPDPIGVDRTGPRAEAGLYTGGRSSARACYRIAKFARIQSWLGEDYYR